MWSSVSVFEMEMVLYTIKHEKCFYKTLYNIKNAVNWNMGLCGLVAVHQKMAPCISISKLPHFVKDMIIKCVRGKFMLQ